MNETRKNNQVTVIGEVVSTFTYSHEIYGEGFYTLMLSIERNSGAKDVIPVMLSEHLLDPAQDYRSEYLMVKGEYRSHNQPQGKPKTRFFVFAQEVELQEGNIIQPFANNEVILSGSICKEPVYRMTPLGRKITDFLLAVNRPYNHSDYIPCIAWGRTAKMVGKSNVGDKITLKGRVQSREYKKNAA